MENILFTSVVLTIINSADLHKHFAFISKSLDRQN